MFVLSSKYLRSTYSIESACLFAKHGIPTRVVLDAAVGAIMEEVDLCLVGAEGVMENGGIVNKVRSLCQGFRSFLYFKFIVCFVVGNLFIYVLSLFLTL